MLTPRWYQVEAVDAAFNFLCTQAGSPIIEMPTGSGKSLVIAAMCRRAVKQFGGRVIVLAHRKELLVQNAEKICDQLPDIEVGIYSAGLKSRHTDCPIVCAGIQSVYERAHEFGERHMVIPDEAHLIPGEGDGMYQKFLRDLRSINKTVRMAGLTATPYRTSEGTICKDGGLFQKICYRVPITKLINEGFLSNLVTLPADSSVDTSGLHINSGEFVKNEMTALFDQDNRIATAVAEIVSKSVGRKSVLLFCAGVTHAERVSRAIEAMTGDECGLVTGTSLPMERAATLQRFKDRQLRWLCNVDVLTTGFDAPCVDAIAILRATESPGLFAQIVGRGLRTYPGKADCLVLDFGENISRHGPLDSDSFGQSALKRREKRIGEGPTKCCPACREQCPLNAKECPCGWKFPPPAIATHETHADGSPILEKDIKSTRWIVESVSVGRHRKKKAEPDDPDTFRVDYSCKPVDTAGNMTDKVISDYICLEHTGWAKRNAVKWWNERSNAPANSIDDAIDLVKRGAMATPSFIETRPQGKFLRIVKYELDEKPESWADAAPQEQSEEHDSFDAFDDVPF